MRRAIYGQIGANKKFGTFTPSDNYALTLENELCVCLCVCVCAFIIGKCGSALCTRARRRADMALTGMAVILAWLCSLKMRALKGEARALKTRGPFEAATSGAVFCA